MEMQNIAQCIYRQSLGGRGGCRFSTEDPQHLNVYKQQSIFLTQSVHRTRSANQKVCYCAKAQCALGNAALIFVFYTKVNKLADHVGYNFNCINPGEVTFDNYRQNEAEKSVKTVQQASI